MQKNAQTKMLYNITLLFYMLIYCGVMIPLCWESWLLCIKPSNPCALVDDGSGRAEPDYYQSLINHKPYELPAVLVLCSSRPFRMDVGNIIGCICSLRPVFRDDSDNRIFAGAQNDRWATPRIQDGFCRPHGVRSPLSGTGGY